MDIAAGGAVRRAAAMLPATSRWRAATTADVALPPEPLTLPLSPRRRQAAAAADVALSRCRHRAAAVALCAATALRAATTGDTTITREKIFACICTFAKATCEQKHALQNLTAKDTIQKNCSRLFF